MNDAPDNTNKPNTVPEDDSTAGDSPVTTARRKILRSLVFTGGVGAGSALIPATWTRPVVEAVTLPAHA